MDKQTYWEDMAINTEIASLSKVATSQMLVKWAGASGDFNPLHWDNSFAVSQGVDMPIVHGALKRQWLVQLMTNLIGLEGSLKKFSCRYRAMDYPRAMKTVTEPEEGESWFCKGKVITKYHENGENLVDLEIWVENSKGENTTPGSATIALPSRC